MKIFAINGSPTMKRGMTHILLENFLQGAQEAGAEVETAFLQKKKIGYCMSCFNCWVKTPGTCAQKDDMGELLNKFREADYFVLASPVYVDGMTAQAKTFLDRMIPLVDAHLELVEGHFRHVLRYEKYPQVVLLSVCGGYEMDNFDGLVDHVDHLCRHLHTRFVGAVLRPGSMILSLEEILPEPVKLIKEAAHRAGKELVQNGSFASKTLDEIARHYLTKTDFLKGVNQFWDRCIEARQGYPA
jgi:multimeric flavodoxin WrbA